MIRVENIRKVFNAHSRNANEVLKGVSFELPNKGLVAIFGKSGSGKTTLLNIIGGLEKPDSGTVYIGNENMKGRADFIRNAQIGYIFQNYYLESGYTVRQIMHNEMQIAGFHDEKEIEKRTNTVLKLVKMDKLKNKKSDALSGGQKQRVAIARALIKGSDVILADEPTGNLDAENTVMIMEILKKISATQLVLLVTHELTLIHDYADFHIKMVDGTVKNNEKLEKDIFYETDRNNIYVNLQDERSYTVEQAHIHFYGESVPVEDLQIFSHKGALYLKTGKDMTVLDDHSEKKIIFETEKQEEKQDFEESFVPKFEKSTSGKNGRLFTFSGIRKALYREEKLFSTGTVFKNLFIVTMALLMCFFSLGIFEVLQVRLHDKNIHENSVYLNLNTYDDIKILDHDLYSKIDFFDTQLKEGDFSFAGITSLSGIKADYVPLCIDGEKPEEQGRLVVGRMPGNGEVLMSKALSDVLKFKFRLEELSNDQAMLQVKFNGKFSVTGIVEGDTPAIYLQKQDYVNFLKVYREIQFLDSEELFFIKDYADIPFTSEIVVARDDRLLAENEVHVEINRNSLYKMMKNVKDADIKVKTANAQLKKTVGRTGLEIKNSYLYVKKLEITRDVMTTDIQIYVHPDTMENIFVYLRPNIDILKGSTSSQGVRSRYYFEVSTSGGKQLEQLCNRLQQRGIRTVDIEKQYEQENEEMQEQAAGSLSVFVLMTFLLFFIYYFIEKSGSLKNSREYGIFRAIGVNRSNLLYKEFIRTLLQNISVYFLFYVLIAALMSYRYYMMNVKFAMFLGISSGIFLLSALIMICISLIPYLFVLFKTPAEILSDYDV